MALIEQTHGTLTREAGLTKHVPALVVVSLVFGDVLRFGLDRHVRRIERGVKKKRVIGLAGVVFFDPTDGAVGPVVGGEMVVGIGIDLDRVVAFVQAFGLKVTGLGVHEAVKLLKTTLQWPRAVITGFVNVVTPSVVPLAHHHGGVTLCTQNFGQGGCIGRNLTRITWEARVGVCDPSTAYRVWVFTCQ